MASEFAFTSHKIVQGLKDSFCLYGTGARKKNCIPCEIFVSDRLRKVLTTI